MPGWRAAATLFAVGTAVGLLLSVKSYIGRVREGDPRPRVMPFVERMVGAEGAAGLMYLALPWIHRFRLRRRRSLVLLLKFYLPAFGLYALLQTTWLWLATRVFYQWMGLRDGVSLDFLHQIPFQAIQFGVFVAIVHGIHHSQESRRHRRRAAHLESALTRARLDCLQLRLQPHFLSNALNAISATAYEDPRRADLLICQLSDFLRHFERLTARETTLAEELALLDRYAEIMITRFGDGLVVRVDVPHDLGDALVPPFLLQPLVENAIRHGSLRQTGRAVVDVKGAREGDTLHLRVSDDGPGLLDSDRNAAGRQGVGLSATAERLCCLYGDDGRLHLDLTPGEGCEVRITLPYRSALAAPGSNFP